MAKGTIKSVRDDKGFAFITSVNLPRDVFLHCKQFIADVPFDQRLIGRDVDFTIEETERGPQAVGCRLVTP